MLFLTWLIGQRWRKMLGEKIDDTLSEVPDYEMMTLSWNQFWLNYN